jgi:HlyD family secretion protein
LRPRVVILLVVGFLAALGSWSLRDAAPAPTQWQGYAEADFVKIGPVQSGLLASVAVARGDQVEAGAPLFAQDQTEDLARRDQAERQLKQAQEQLANLQAASKPTEIQQAEANLADARAAHERAQLDLIRAQDLVGKGDATYQTLDQRRADEQSARAHVAALEAALTQTRAPLGRDREIEAAGAAVEASEAALAMAEWRLDQRRVAAPTAGRIADVLARPGEVMAAGAPVVSLLPPENIYVRFFVSEADLATVHRGQKVLLACDDCPPDLSATVRFISPQAEYTPPVIYSDQSRAKLVIMVEARPPPDRAALLNPGQPIVVRPAPQGVGP